MSRQSEEILLQVNNWPRTGRKAKDISKTEILGGSRGVQDPWGERENFICFSTAAVTAGGFFCAPNGHPRFRS